MLPGASPVLPDASQCAGATIRAAPSNLTSCARAVSHKPDRPVGADLHAGPAPGAFVGGNGHLVGNGDRPARTDILTCPAEEALINVHCGRQPASSVRRPGRAGSERSGLLLGHALFGRAAVEFLLAGRLGRRRGLRPFRRPRQITTPPSSARTRLAGAATTAAEAATARRSASASAAATSRRACSIALWHGYSCGFLPAGSISAIRLRTASRAFSSCSAWAFSAERSCSRDGDA